MKRSYFIRQLLSLPLGSYMWHKFFKDGQSERYLLNKFHVAGFQYYSGPSMVEEITIGEVLQLKAEPDNPYDTFAVAVLRKGTMLGHIPRSDNKHISRLLQQEAKLSCDVRRANAGNETWKMLKVAVYLL